VGYFFVLIGLAERWLVYASYVKTSVYLRPPPLSLDELLPRLLPPPELVPPPDELRDGVLIDGDELAGGELRVGELIDGEGVLCG
jgi:hypothetical protein